MYMYKDTDQMTLMNTNKTPKKVTLCRWSPFVHTQDQYLTHDGSNQTFYDWVANSFCQTRNAVTYLASVKGYVVLVHYWLLSQSKNTSINWKWVSWQWNSITYWHITCKAWKQDCFPLQVSFYKKCWYFFQFYS